MISLIKHSFNLPIVGVWDTYKVTIDVDSPLFRKAQEQASIKCQFTMNAGQDGFDRSKSIKYQMQLMGILAEIACQYYLNKIIYENGIINTVAIRYDDVRTDGFKSPENEFDIRVLNEITNSYINVESRSSITYNREFEVGLSQYDIIGYYSSIAKHKEGLNDIYLRPLYRCITIPLNDYKSNFEQYFITGRIELYLVAGCTIKDMKKKGYDKSMGQGATMYRCVRIINASDIISFEKNIVEIINEDIKT